MSSLHMSVCNQMTSMHNCSYFPLMLILFADSSASKQRSSQRSEGKAGKMRDSNTILLPCFGHDQLVIDDITSVISSSSHGSERSPSTGSQSSIRDILEQPLSSVHDLCMQYRQTGSGCGQTESVQETQAADFITSTCFLIGSYLVSQSASSILLEEAFSLFMHRGLVERQKLARLSPISSTLLVSTLSSLAASSNNILSISSSTVSLLDAVQKSISCPVDVRSGKGARAREQQSDFTLCLYMPADSIFQMQVCVLVHSSKLKALLLDSTNRPLTPIGSEEDSLTQQHYESFVGLQRSLGLSQQDNFSVQRIPIKTTAQPVDPAANFPSPRRIPVHLSTRQQELATELAHNCHDHMRRNALDVPGQTFTKVDFIVLVQQSCPVYVDMMQRLINSPAVELMLQSRGLPTTHSQEFVKARVVCVNNDESILAVRLADLRSYANNWPQTLFLIIAKSCLKSPQRGGQAHSELEELLLLPNTLMISSMTSHYSWLAKDSLLPPCNVIQFRPEKSSYHSTEALLDSYSWKPTLTGNGDSQRWTLDEQYESAVSMATAKQSK